MSVHKKTCQTNSYDLIFSKNKKRKEKKKKKKKRGVQEEIRNSFCALVVVGQEKMKHPLMLPLIYHRNSEGCSFQFVAFELLLFTGRNINPSDLYAQI